jgi:small subunit ribosomal protein S17
MAEEPETTRAQTADDAPVAETATPKERRTRRRSGKAPARAPSTPEERRAERVAERRRKASARRAGRLQEREKAKAAGKASAATPPREHVQGKQKSRSGVVVSDRAAKTITVRIDIARRHRRYEKIVRTSTTLHAHDEHEEAHVGDTVLVRESRPLSRTKRWRLIEVLERAR